MQCCESNATPPLGEPAGFPSRYMHAQDRRDGWFWYAQPRGAQRHLKTDEQHSSVGWEKRHVIDRPTGSREGDLGKKPAAEHIRSVLRRSPIRHA